MMVGLGLGLDGDVDNRVGELDGLEDDGVGLIAQGLTGGGVLQADSSADIASTDEVDVMLLVGVHLQKAADALLLAVDGVDDVRASIQTAGVAAQVGELADKGIGHDLEGQSGERSLLVCRALLLLIGIGVGTDDSGDVERAGQVIDDSVEKLLHAFVLVGRTHEDQVELGCDDALAQSSLDLLDGDVLLHEDGLHELLVEVCSGVEKLLMHLFCLGLELLGDGVEPLGVGHALVICLEVPCLHGDQVDDAPELILGTHGQLGCDSVSAQTVLHGLDGMLEVRADAVILVDEGDGGDVVALSLAPNGLGLGLNTGNSVKDSYSAVQNAQGALDLRGEVDVARGVDDLNLVGLAVLGTGGVAPKAGGSSRRNGNAALLLLNHPVHGSCTLVNLTDLVGLAGVVEDALGRGGLAGIDVCHDTDVASVFQRNLLSHFLPRPRNGSGRTRGWPRPS